MKQSKTIKLFIASSTTELRLERMMLGDYIMNSIRPLFLCDGIDVEVEKSEDINKGYTDRATQDIIDDRIRKSNLFFLLIKHTVGKYTRHEFDLAREVQAQDWNNPIMTIYAYFIQDRRKICPSGMHFKKN